MAIARMKRRFGRWAVVAAAFLLVAALWAVFTSSGRRTSLLVGYWFGPASTRYQCAEDVPSLLRVGMNQFEVNLLLKGPRSLRDQLTISDHGTERSLIPIRASNEVFFVEVAFVDGKAEKWELLESAKVNTNGRIRVELRPRSRKNAQ